MRREELIKKYEENLARFCYHIAWLSTLTKEYKTTGDNSLLTDLKLLAENVKRGKECILKYKAALNYEGGLSFLENNRFDGFEIKDGLLEGYDPSIDEKLDAIISPWINNGPESNCYLYEVGIYIRFMAWHTLIPLHEHEEEEINLVKTNKRKETRIWLKERMKNLPKIFQWILSKKATIRS